MRKTFLHTEFSNKIVAGHPLVGDPLYRAGGVTKNTPHPELKVWYAYAMLQIYEYIRMLVTMCVCV